MWFLFHLELIFTSTWLDSAFFLVEKAAVSDGAEILEVDSWLDTMLPLRRWLRYVLVLSFFFGVVIPFLLFLLTNTYGVLETESSLSEGRNKLYSSREANRRPLEASNPQAEEVQFQVEELQRIVVSVRNELRELESERNRLKREVDSSKTTLSKVRKEVGIAKSSLQESKGRLAKSLRDTKRATQNDDHQHDAAAKSDIVVIKLPDNSAMQPGHRSEPRTTLEDGPVYECTDAVCFDYSRCPLTSPLSVYIYNQHLSDLFDLKYPATVTDLAHSLQQKHSLVKHPDSACIFLVVVGPLKMEMDGKKLRQKLESLSHWKDSGRNHVIMALPYFNESHNTNLNLLGQSILAKGHAAIGERKGFNILLPPVTRHGDDPQSVWKSIPPTLPALRQYLIVHEGFQWEPSQQPEGQWISPDHLSSWREAIASNTKDKVLVSVKCSGTADRPGVVGAGTSSNVGRLGEWRLCGSAAQRASLLSKATFSLVLGSQSGTTGPETYTRLIEGLRYGAIPVVLGINHLPFGTVIDWKRAVIILPISAFGQLHFILRNIAPESILQYRRQGRFLWDTYFSSPLRILEAALGIVRQRALHPPPAAPPFTAATNLVSIPGEYRTIHSPKFLYNFTIYSEELWNSPPGPLYMYPTTPFKPRPVSGSQYTGLTSKQISNLPPHVIDAGGITGPFFEDYLLGNTPEEQFTIVMLTYERNDVLLDALVRLTDLDYLAKVVVVWNNPSPPPSDMKWPEIGTTIDVSLSRLNNQECSLMFRLSLVE